MKNVFKLFGLMLLAGSFALVSCGDKEENTDTNTNNNGEETTYKITVNCNDATLGTVSITPSQDTYKAGDQVTITATANAGNKFENWNGNITDNPYTFEVTGNATYTANFKAIPQPTYSITFDGSALDVAGFSDFQCAQQDGFMIYLAQFAKNAESTAEGTNVYFPYVVMWLAADNDPSSLQIYNENLELYRERSYSAGGNNYGDWQYVSTNNMNCSAMDLTTYTLSFTGSFTMYYLGDIVNGDAEDPSECTQKTLNFTGSNLTFTPASKGLRKMNIKK